MNNKKPNFICIGAQRTGTTSLFHALKQHPNIYIPPIKETHFFNNELIFNKGLDWWLGSYYKNLSDEDIISDFTPDYLYSELAPKRIFDLLGPEVKFLAIIRNPVERAYSNYLMNIRRGIEQLSFDEALVVESDRTRKDKHANDNYAYIGRGLYFNQLKNYLKYYKKENFLLICFEEQIAKNFTNTLSEIERFLGISNYNYSINKIYNQSGKQRSKLISNFLNKQNALKKIGGKVVRNYSQKARIWQIIDNFNLKPAQFERLSNKDINYYIEKYFIDDIHALEKLLKRNFTNWYSN